VSRLAAIVWGKRNGKVTGLSGNEIYCLALKQYSAGELVVGNSVNSIGFLGSLCARLTNILGGEVPQVTQAIHEGRAAALARLTAETSASNWIARIKPSGADG
jgi:Putative heavy-metal-binding